MAAKMGSKTTSLKDDLTAALPENFQCKVRHFLSASVNPSGEATPRDVLVLGIEVLVYSTKHLTTIFVSKADSTGFLQRQRPSPVQTIITTFLSWLSNQERQKHPSRRIVISLFARAQSQYLFPGSAENSKKHVLDDRQLIKWWARVLDPIIPSPGTANPSDDNQEASHEGYITVPGYEGAEVRQFMPPSNGSSGRPRWKSGNPLPELAQARQIQDDAPPRCLLPRFPDDPKARFMQDLDDEIGLTGDTANPSPTKKRKSGKWSSIRDLDRFWEAMEFRQECSSGRMVGFLWLVTRPPPSSRGENVANGASQESMFDSQNSEVLSQPEEVASVSRSPTKRRRKPLSGPIIPRQPRLKGGSSSLTASSDLSGMLDTGIADGVVLPKEGYAKAMQTLLHLEFNTLDAAVTSTSKWVSEVSATGGFQAGSSIEVQGTAKVATSAVTNGGNAQVNDLGGMIRKKRKLEDPFVSRPEEAQKAQPAVNVLGAGMIRKKTKPVSS
ncbi:uncharacterized protein LTR77_011082 [Saxophila tyrrhenica]|uniref:histone acetyltransferase n=1 Tax=Saxophila tyrrhenica TaxID=1690608 RepID=A0AAV9NTT7_9PEZI|nr:hypothetical protein LTR77_011082 [Saxophila tyrrhenica]